MTRTLVIVRTHRADVASLAAFDLLAEAGLDADIVFCVDEREQAADMGARAKVSFSQDTLARLGLYAHRNCGWRCGDYSYYVTRDARPDYDYYWLIEPDVRIHVDSLADFFAPLAHVSADLLAAQYGPRSNLWGWTRTIAASGLPAYGCLYPITRLSGRGIDTLLKIRREWSADSTMATALDWPNDEAFTATALTAAGFVCRDLNAEMTCYTAQSFGVTAVVDYDLVLQSSPNGLIYHPVRDFIVWLEHAERRIGSSNFGAGVGGRSRADASYLSGVAQACLGHPLMPGAALVPLMLALDLWTERRWADGQPFDTVAADLNQAELCAEKLHRRFGVSAQHGPKAVASLARAKPQAGGVPSANDFDLRGEMPGRFYPAHFAVPYAFDIAKQEVLSTLHVSTRDILAAPEPASEQLRTARAVARMSFDAAHRVKTRRPPEWLVSVVFGVESLSAGVISAACQTGGKTILNIPGPLVQLLADASLRRDFAALPQERRGDLLRWCLLSFLRLHVHGCTRRHAVMCLPWSAYDLTPALVSALQPAETIFVVLDDMTKAASGAVPHGMRRTGADQAEDVIGREHAVRFWSTGQLLASLEGAHDEDRIVRAAPVGSAA